MMMFRAIGGTRVLTVMLAVCLVLNGLMIGDAAPRKKKPVIDLKSEVTSRSQIGVLHKGVVILCPKGTKHIDLSNRQSGRFEAKAKSASASTASASVAKNKANHVILTIQAGENNTNRDKITTITVKTRSEILQVGMPQAPGRGTQDKGHGIHGKGKNSRPKTIQGSRSKVRTGKITVRVLAKKKCAALPPEKPKSRIGMSGAKKRPKGRIVKLCVNGKRRYKIQSVIRLGYDYQYRNQKVDGKVPKVGNLRILKNTNPAVVAADVYGHKTKKSKTIVLVFSGLKEGTSTVKVIEAPAPFGVPPFRETFHVTVEKCNPKKTRLQLTGHRVPKGYIKLPVPVYKEKDPLIRELDKELEELDRLEKEEAEKEKSSGNSSSTDSRQSRLIQDRFDNVGAGLASFVAEGEGGQDLNVLCPNDAESGDVVSCSVFSDGEEAKGYSVEVVSTKTFTDEHEPGGDTVRENGLVNVLIPAGVREVLLAIRNTGGQVVGEGHLGVSHGGAHAASATFGVPDTVALSEPIALSGPFTDPVEQTSALINGETAQVLAKSPRTLVVDNPVTVPGTTELLVEEGGLALNHTIEIVDQPLPNEVGGAPNGAESNQEGLLDNNAAPDGCSETVSGYRKGLQARINKSWNPPKPSSKGEWNARLRYSVDKQGRISNIRVVQSSGDKAIDAAAKRHVGAIKHLPAVPQCHSNDDLEINHTFRVIYH